MRPYRFDGTFTGFLAAVFAAYKRAEAHPVFVRDDAPSLFGQALEISCDDAHAARVEAGITRHGGAETRDLLYHAFLSDVPGVEQFIWEYLRLLFAKGVGAAENPLAIPGPAVRKAARNTGREVHRMHAFVRFEERVDGWWEASISPECNVLPLLGDHFGERYAAMRWAIVDVRRRIALCHDDGTLRLIRATAIPAEKTADEAAWQRMWRAYYEAVNIPERENLRLRQRHVPRRYWPHLTELRGG